MAAIALLRLHHYTEHQGYRDKAEQTLETFAGITEQFGIFAATYGMAVLHFLESPVQVVVIEGEDNVADELYAAAVEPFAVAKSSVRLPANQAVAQNLPPSLAETIPSLPQIKEGRSFAVLCSGMSCRPPVFSSEELRSDLFSALRVEQ
jgi:hypothetical protein